MFISVTREDKNEFAQRINEKLNNNIFNKLMNIYTSIKKQKEKN